MKKKNFKKGVIKTDIAENISNKEIISKINDFESLPVDIEELKRNIKEGRLIINTEKIAEKILQDKDFFNLLLSEENEKTKLNIKK